MRDTWGGCSPLVALASPHPHFVSTFRGFHRLSSAFNPGMSTLRRETWTDQLDGGRPRRRRLI
jgi:hypothetical protein